MKTELIEQFICFAISTHVFIRNIMILFIPDKEYIHNIWIKPYFYYILGENSAIIYIYCIIFSLSVSIITHLITLSRTNTQRTIRFTTPDTTTPHHQQK